MRGQGLHRSKLVPAALSRDEHLKIIFNED